MDAIKRIFVEKKTEFATEAKRLHADLVEAFDLPGLAGLRIVYRYDVQGISEAAFERARYTLFAEPQVDIAYDEGFTWGADEQAFAVEYLPGQFDQRADSAAQALQIITHAERPIVATAVLYVLKGELDAAALANVRNYCINPVDSREARLDKPPTLRQQLERPADVAVLTDFTAVDAAALAALRAELGLAMSQADIEFCQQYFHQQEQRDPTITELRMLDTYWSDHCRHTTFHAQIESVEFEPSPLNAPAQAAWDAYMETRRDLYGADTERDVCLMDLAIIGAKALRKQGKLDNLEVSEEINAASIVVPVMIDGATEEWLLMFKNETHNHPTEIEPFGGAATCLGGAIRDPLSGRAYVYQAMRVTGCADPRTPIAETLPGKLPQRTITVGAAQGYSAYGNQIGLATGQVAEIYHPNYVAKRMEIGAVVAAAPRANVVRGVPAPGDCVVLTGGRTGRDGIGGATGSSKEHTDTALENCTEVQKGDPPMERKLQRLFRRSEVSRLIKRCNDFGAGGVSVAIGELAPSLDIDLDCVPKKYVGLDGTELAISESQERMAVVVDAKDVDAFIAFADEENLEAVTVARVTDTGRLRMTWRGQTIVDVDRQFLDTNGVTQTTAARVTAPVEAASPLLPVQLKDASATAVAAHWKTLLSDLNHCSQKGLVEHFDSTIGAGTVQHPFGGRYKATPIEAMSALIAVEHGACETASVMSFGFNPYLSSWSPFHGAYYAVVESLAKIVATGGQYRQARLTLQEYFERLNQEPERWGKPLAALLGAYRAQALFETAAIGGKDSMSGTFNDIDVPPTLCSFAVTTSPADALISPELKAAGHPLYALHTPIGADGLLDEAQLLANWDTLQVWMAEKTVVAAHSVRTGGIAVVLSKMAFGNRIGARLAALDVATLFSAGYGSFVIESVQPLEDPALVYLGETQASPRIEFAGQSLDLLELQSLWEAPLESVFPTHTQLSREDTPLVADFVAGGTFHIAQHKVAQPRVFIPIFPGTNCEYDSARAFAQAGAQPQTLVFRNRTVQQIDASIEQMVAGIRAANILMIPGGFSAGDEPDGSGKFIAAVFRNPQLADATMDLIRHRDGLILGICNGFQALIKLGLVPYGDIRDMTEHCPTLTFNDIGRHVSCYVRTKVTSNLSPWLAMGQYGKVYNAPVSHGEGKFVASDTLIAALAEQGQIATQYVDANGHPTYAISDNPNGSYHAVEGITSPDGRVYGKMAHCERVGKFVGTNISGEKYQPLFAAGVAYFQ